MNTATMSLQKARRLAASLRTSRRSGSSWHNVQDRDFLRETQDIYLMAQSSTQRVL